MEPLHNRFPTEWQIAEYFPHIIVCHPTSLGCWIIRSYHKDGKHTLIFVGCMHGALWCATVPVIRRLVFQVSPNHVWTTLMLPTDKASQTNWIISNTAVRNANLNLPKFHLYRQKIYATNTRVTCMCHQISAITNIPHYWHVLCTLSPG